MNPHEGSGPPRTASRGAPAPLVVAASLAAVEAMVLVLFGVAELVDTSQARATMGATTAVFFLVAGAALLVCGWGLSRRRRWSRGPVLLAQLIQLGVAWNFHGGETTALAVGLAVTALLVLVGLLHPASLDALGSGD